MVRITAVRAAGMRCWTKVCTQNAPADATRPVATRVSQTSRGGKTTGSKKGQPKDTEDQRYREHLGEGEPRRVVSGGVAGEESYVQTQRGGAQEGE